MAAWTLSSFQPDADHDALHDRQHYRAIAGVLSDFAPTDFAFLREPLEIGKDDR